MDKYTFLAIIDIPVQLFARFGMLAMHAAQDMRITAAFLYSSTIFRYTILQVDAILQSAVLSGITSNKQGGTIMLSQISENLQKGKAKIVKQLVQEAIDAGISAQEILEKGLIAGMNVVGEKFRNNEIFVPEVLVAARALNMGSALLKPLLAADGVKASGRVCIGTVQGDLHDIGKNLVKMMMEGKGLEVIDLGTDVTADTFVKTAIEQDCQIICCSALLTTTMPVMAEVVKAAEAAGIRNKVKIMIGGAPVTQDYCDQIGADAYSDDAASAADMAVSFCS